ncbi:MAG: Hpt domain-containing protein [Candidatus Dadabacteria bacterium]|nr:MAG: Hpt domain-containing protein [Candidatus Dadabacteria bacterium]
MSERLVITVSDVYADLVEPYLAQRRAELEDWRRMLEQGNFEDLRRVAHRVRGSGGSYGVRPLSDLAGELEAAAVAGAADACSELIGQIADLLDRLEIRFE